MNEKITKGNIKKMRLGLLKDTIIVVFALAFLIVGTFSWYDYKTPGAVTIGIDEPTAEVVVEKYNEDTGGYDSVDSTANSFNVEIPPITFYEWMGSLVSTFGDNLLYRITITSNFSATNFTNTPLFYASPSLDVASDEPELLKIKILQAEYRVSTPTESVANFQNAFPPNGFSNLFPPSVQASSPNPDVVYNNDLTFPDTDFPTAVEKVTIAGVDKFQTIFYLKITPDSDAVASIMSLLTSAVPKADNTIHVSFGYRSVPYYTPPTP